MRAARAALVLACLSAFLLPPRASAGVGVVLNESLHESMDRITGTGHTAVYFSNICPESPVKLRLCRPGELGSVMSIYINIGEDQRVGWNIVPLSIYLFGVEDPADRPIFGSYKIKHLLEDRYRERYLVEYCETRACQTSMKAEWREMVAATLIRSVYIFAVDTTEEQDHKIIEEFNSDPNKNDFNGFKWNCADFTRHVINTYFPGAVRRDYLNDFGMTSPKAVARTFTRYALRHPELHFRAMHFGQVPGTIKTSSEVRAGTEQMYRSKKWLVPMLLFADHELPVAAASYLIHGRFNPQRTFEKYAQVEPEDEILTDAAAPQVAVTSEQRQAFVGTPEEWKAYRKSFGALTAANKKSGEERDFRRFFKNLDRAGTPSLDNDGSVWVEMQENGEPLKVGLSADNTLERNSNRHLAHQFLMAHAGTELKNAKHRRETMQEFKQDWAKLQRVSAEMSESLASGSSPETGTRSAITASADKE